MKIVMAAWRINDPICVASVCMCNQSAYYSESKLVAMYLAASNEEINGNGSK